MAFLFWVIAHVIFYWICNCWSLYGAFKWLMRWIKQWALHIHDDIDLLICQHTGIVQCVQRILIRHSSVLLGNLLNSVKVIIKIFLEFCSFKLFPHCLFHFLNHRIFCSRLYYWIKVLVGLDIRYLDLLNGFSLHYYLVFALVGRRCHWLGVILDVDRFVFGDLIDLLYCFHYEINNYN